MAEKSIDIDTIRKLSKALAFIKGAEDPCTLAMKTAAESGDAKDVKRAHAAFLKLKPGDRAAALAMISG